MPNQAFRQVKCMTDVTNSIFRASMHSVYNAKQGNKREILFYSQQRIQVVCFSFTFTLR